MAAFTLSVSEDLVAMQTAYHPVALVLLAYWCALWFELEEQNVLLRSHSAALLRMLAVGLGPDYASFIRHSSPSW
jgi:hypothetical protein